MTMTKNEYVKDEFYVDYHPHQCIRNLFRMRVRDDDDMISSSLVSRAWDAHESNFWWKWWEALYE